MKKLITTTILAALVATMTTVMAQDYPEEYLGLPGDNLNLYAVMKLFQESPTIEAFERSLNEENSRINNLDLNNDGKVDYIDVVDYVDGNVHSIVLRALLGPKESQDVAVFTVQKFNDGSVQIQLVGDEELYGKNYIIEPYYDENTGETVNPGYVGKQSVRTNVTIIRTTPFEIAAWPLIRFIYMPDYVVWRSRWYWGYYPPYWRPWRPLYWHYYYGYHYNWYHTYYSHYRPWHSYRYSRYNDFYYHSVRVFSPQVNINIRDGRYRGTYSHPEQRKEGEALYSRTYHNQEPGRNDGRIDNSRRRDNMSQPERTQKSENVRTGNNRQSERTVNTRTNGAQNREQRSVERQNTNVNRNQNETMRERNTQRIPESRNQEVSRRTSPQVSERPSAKSEQRQKEVSSRAPRSQRSEGASVNRSSRENRSGNAERKSEKSGGKERSKENRR